MKKLYFLFLLSTSILFTGCLRDECISHTKFVRFDPIYKTVDAIRNEVSVTIGKELKNPGKIYVYNQYLLINEVNEGIHIFDNSNTAAPRSIAFLNIPGNRDMAVRSNFLYADNTLDILTFDISNTSSPKLVKRLENVFNRSFGWNNQWPANQPILVGYSQTNVTQIVDCASPNFNQPFFGGGNGGLWLNALDFSRNTTAQSAGAPGINAGSGNKATGVGGSMSRFGIVGNYLYGIDQSDLHVIYIENPANPREGKSVQVAWNIETLFPYKDKLFVGAQNGMFILDNKNPESPVLLSSFTHARACDPVYVDDDIAYVTLVGGGRCGNSPNELDVIDISNITSPRLIKRYTMDHPLGLSVLDKILYLCEGQFGLKIFDVKDVNAIDKNLLSQYQAGYHAYDVIALDHSHLIVVGENGLNQLDASNPKKIKVISTIPVVKK